MNRARYWLNALVFAWWDGVMSCASIINSISMELADYALVRMQNATRNVIAIKESTLSPEAIAYAARVDRQREELHDTIRACVVKLNELDAVYARIHYVGRKSK